MCRASDDSDTAENQKHPFRRAVGSRVSPQHRLVEVGPDAAPGAFSGQGPEPGGAGAAAPSLCGMQLVVA
jgi:hypothetical protein